MVQVVEEIWEIYMRICSYRLHPFLPEEVMVLERRQELSLSPVIKQLLLRMSHATIDHCLKKLDLPIPNTASPLPSQGVYSKNHTNPHFYTLGR